MKTDSNNLGQLLAEVEHAGRDARRREELGAMIDHMAAAEGGKSKHGIGWWSLRVAAAACALFFVGTAVRIWFIPTKPSGSTLVASTDISAQADPVAVHDSTIIAPSTHKPVVRRAQPIGKPVDDEQEEILPVEVEMTPIVEEHIEPCVEPVSEVEEMMVDMLVSEEPILAEQVADTVAAAGIQETAVEIHTSSQQQEQSLGRSLLKAIFPQPEPDEMTGTMLAFRIL